jgi:hypothetical protein
MPRKTPTTIEPSPFALDLGGADEIAAYIRRPVRETRRLIDRGVLPVVRVGEGTGARLYSSRAKIDEALRALQEQAS